MLDLIRESSIPLAIGSLRRRHGSLLTSFFQYLREGGQVYCLDTGNCFDPYPLAEMARSQGLSSNEILNNLFVSRAATCHQIVSVVEEMILPLAEDASEKLVIALAIDTLFVDEDIPLFEREYLFDRILKGMLEASRSMGCLVTYNPELKKDPSAKVWHRALERRFRTNLRFKETEDGEDHPNFHPLLGNGNGDLAGLSSSAEQGRSKNLR